MSSDRILKRFSGSQLTANKLQQTIHNCTATAVQYIVLTSQCINCAVRHLGKNKIIVTIIVICCLELSKCPFDTAETVHLQGTSSPDPPQHHNVHLASGEPKLSRDHAELFPVLSADAKKEQINATYFGLTVPYQLTMYGFLLPPQ